MRLSQTQTIEWKAPLCKGGWRRRRLGDCKISIIVNYIRTIPPSFATQNPPPFTQGRLSLRLFIIPTNYNLIFSFGRGKFSQIAARWNDGVRRYSERHRVVRCGNLTSLNYLVSIWIRISLPVNLHVIKYSIILDVNR